MFEQKYSKQVWNDNEPLYHPGNCTILPFFGYHARLNSVGYQDSYGGNYTVTAQGNNTYKVSKSREYFYTRYNHYAEYERGENLSAYEPKLNQLEEEFYDRYIKKGGVDIWYSPYISPTLEDFHKKKAKLKNSGLLAALGAICIPLAVASIILIGIVFADAVQSLLPEFLPIEPVQIAAAPFVVLMGIGVLSLIKRHKDIKELRAKPYEQMPKEYKNDLRTKYFKYMKSTYRGRLGEILQEYYLLRESALQKKHDAIYRPAKTKKK